MAPPVACMALGSCYMYRSCAYAHLPSHRWLCPQLVPRLCCDHIYTPHIKAVRMQCNEVTDLPGN